MSRDDRIRWDAKYREASARPRRPSPFLVSVADILPPGGRALDVAGGAGANAVWLAGRGWDVTLADISPVGLSAAREHAQRAGVVLRTLEIDLEQDAFPSGPWDLIVCVHFLWRPLFATIPGELAPGGVLVAVHPTRSNLSRHESPGPRHLLEDGELPGLVSGLELLKYEEGWTEEGQHDARLAARRGPARHLPWNPSDLS
jgi:SAM-dependent methyltransferase